MVAPGDKNNGGYDKRINNNLGIGKGTCRYFFAKPGKINQRQTKEDGARGNVGTKKIDPLVRSGRYRKKTGWKNISTRANTSPGQSNPLDLKEQLPGPSE